VSPRARHAAARHGLDPDALPGSGPGGRVIERDVTAAAASGAPLSAAAREARAAGGLQAPARGSGPAGRVLASDLRPGASATVPAAASDRSDRTLPVTGIRKIIAQRMRESLGSTAQLTMTRRVNASAIQRFRSGVKTHGETFGLPVATVNDLIVFAVSRTLPRHPELNAHFLGDRIVQFAAVNLGIAVDTPRGLMVPVLRHADTLPLRDLAAGIRPLAEACQKGNVNPDHLSGGTFTITNLGALGVETFTPVLNAPEVAILGVGGLTLQPVRTADGIQFVDTLHLSLTIDHQAVDGAPAARFLKDLAESLEHIELLIAAGG
jgi:pyruvate dehydrogenase E2 component (dihydrolipoamide acetyltransferase)